MYVNWNLRHPHVSILKRTCEQKLEFFAMLLLPFNRYNSTPLPIKISHNFHTFVHSTEYMLQKTRKNDKARKKLKIKMEKVCLGACTLYTLFIVPSMLLMQFNIIWYICSTLSCIFFSFSVRNTLLKTCWFRFRIKGCWAYLKRILIKFFK